MIVRIYTGDDGQTHFEDLPLPAEESRNIALQAGANLVFRRFPADHWSDWHTAPRPAIHFYSRGAHGDRDRRWHHAAVLDRVMWSSLTTSQARATRPLGGSSADRCRCAGGHLNKVLPTIHV